MGFRKIHHMAVLAIAGVFLTALLVPDDAEAKKRNPRRARACRCCTNTETSPYSAVLPGTMGLEHIVSNGSSDLRVNPVLPRNANMAAAAGAVPKPLVITSGFRGCTRNCRVGGAYCSAHLRGNAIDLRSRNPVAHARALSSYNRGGTTLYNNCGAPHVHFQGDGGRGFGSECGRIKGRRRR